MTVSVKQLFGEELAEQVKDRLGDTYVIVEEEQHIPKGKFESVRDEIKQLKKQLEERDDQLETLQTQAKGNEELESTIQELRDQNDALQQQHEQEITERDLHYAVDMRLRDEQARNPRAVKALLDWDTIKLDDDGRVVGLDEQLKKIKESDDYLFGETGVKGKDPKTDVENPDDLGENPWSEEHWNLTEQMRLFRNDPDAARELRERAGVKS